ncbi:MAG: hypothetical protein IV100_33375 [Myxococcales bacterium]|nr:hypothetical protein [Myxococcales bacterium]
MRLMIIYTLLGSVMAAAADALGAGAGVSFMTAVIGPPLLHLGYLLLRLNERG